MRLKAILSWKNENYMAFVNQSSLNGQLSVHTLLSLSPNTKVDQFHFNDFFAIFSANLYLYKG